MYLFIYLDAMYVASGGLLPINDEVFYWCKCKVQYWTHVCYYMLLIICLFVFLFLVCFLLLLLLSFFYIACYFSFIIIYLFIYLLCIFESDLRVPFTLRFSTQYISATTATSPTLHLHQRTNDLSSLTSCLDSFSSQITLHWWAASFSVNCLLIIE